MSATEPDGSATGAAAAAAAAAVVSAAFRAFPLAAQSSAPGL